MSSDGGYPFLELSPDADGVTHFQQKSMPLMAARGPGGLPVFESQPLEARTISVFRIPKGQSQTFHVDEANMFVIVLSGEVELEAADGEKRRFGPGSLGLVNDTAGRGHCTNAIGDGDVLLALVTVP